MLRGRACPHRKPHIPRLLIRAVEVEAAGEVVADVAEGGFFEVAAEVVAVLRVGAGLDDRVGAFDGAEASEVGEAVLGDEGLDGVLVVVDVAAHGHDG